MRLKIVHAKIETNQKLAQNTLMREKLKFIFRHMKKRDFWPADFFSSFFIFYFKID